MHQNIALSGYLALHISIEIKESPGEEKKIIVEKKVFCKLLSKS